MKAAQLKCLVFHECVANEIWSKSANPKKFAQFEQMFGVLINPKKIASYFKLIAQDLAADDCLDLDRFGHAYHAFHDLSAAVLPADLQTAFSDDQQEMQPPASPRGSIVCSDRAERIRVKSDPEKPTDLNVGQGPGLPNFQVETRQIVASDCP